MKNPYSKGGLVKGGDKDRVPVMLIPGEVRISRAVFDKYRGETFFRKLNGGETTQIICIVDEKEENGNTP